MMWWTGSNSTAVTPRSLTHANESTADRLGVRIDQQLRRSEATAGRGVVAAVDAVAVGLPGTDARQVAVPVERRPLLQFDALFVLAVVEAQLDTLGVLREE